MKKSFFSVLTLALLFTYALAACSNDAKDAKNVDPEPKAKALTTQILPNYRYVDIDSVLNRYNLAKDYNEEMMRMQGNFENEAKRHDNAIKSFGNTMQNKYQNNQYTEQSFNADQAKLQQMQQSAQTSLEKLQTANAKAAMEAEKVIQDSIKSFIEDYNATHHYDAILYKAATLYINPELDITDEVIEGLNARYNKVNKK